jgi:fused signal recognition particle receptor
MDPAVQSGAQVATVAGTHAVEFVAVALVLAAVTAAMVWIRRRSRARAASEADTGLVAVLRDALGRSRAALQGRLDALFAGSIDEAALEEMESTLISADVGVDTTHRIVDVVRSALRAGEKDPGKLRERLRAEVRRIVTVGNSELAPPASPKPWVILVVGVNGSGKTTTIGKLSARWVRDGHRVLIGAADTFRAAAIEQLEVWAQRAGAEIVKHQEGADPAAVAFDALQAGIARKADIVIIDTAGRLQNRKPLMDQLSKIRRVIDKALPGAPHETLLVVDGTMGQNALSQATLFHEAAPLTGVVVTKLDGTAKGGMVVTLASELQLPVKLIGVGEKLEDLRPFDGPAYVEALL